MNGPTPPARRSLRRALWLVLCVAMGLAVGVVGHALSNSQWWFLALPLAVALGWLLLADPTQCESGQGSAPRKPH